MATTTMTTPNCGPSSRVADEKVYVAVGSDVEDNATTLLWALQKFGAHRDFRILHVHQPELAKQSMKEILDECIHMCDQAEVTAKKRHIEMQDIGAGILELIDQHAIRKLVMGAAANCHYSEGMTQLKSQKAQFVNQRAHPSCQIWFICKGNLIYLRECKLAASTADATVSSPPASSASQSGSVPSTGSADSRSDSNEAPDIHALVRYESVDKSGHTLESNSTTTWVASAQHLPLSSPMEGSHADELIEQLGKALSDVANTKREALEELIRRQKAEKALIEANRRADALDALEKSYAGELRHREILEEKLAEEKERCERIDNRRKDLEALLENALNAYEELLANQARETSSSTSCRQKKEFISEFSFSEIQEATDNFDPSLKIGEGEYGSMYKGFLRHTQVVIKMMCPDSSQGPSQFHQEVLLSSKFRHPNLVTLIGVCSEAWALVYEYLPNGSLEDRLSCRDNTAPLSWQTRIRICTDTCAALIFLHSGEPHGMLHGDLKPENILLDANCMAKLCNFGLYSEPIHYTTTGEFSVESDVYSFGTVLLRLLSGQVALNLDEIVQNALDDGNLDAAFDQTAGNWPLEHATELAHLALRCCEIDCGNRPDLRSEVWPILKAMRALCEEVSTSVHSSSEERCQPPSSYLICPIKHEIMEDPHVAADGFTYEGEAIREWLTRRSTSPMTNLQLENHNLYPNKIVRSIIQEWLQGNRENHN